MAENMEESDKSTCIGGCGVVKNLKNIYLSAEKVDETFRELIGIEIFKESFLCENCIKKLVEFKKFKDSCWTFHENQESSVKENRDAFPNFLQLDIKQETPLDFEMEDESKSVDTSELFGEDASETGQFQFQNQGGLETFEITEVGNKCEYCERRGKVKVISSHYNLVRHLREFHAEELEGDDKSVLNYVKRRKRSKKWLKTGQEAETDVKNGNSGTDEKQIVQHQSQNPRDEFQVQVFQKSDDGSEADPSNRNQCKYCERKGKIKVISSHYNLVRHLREFHAKELEGEDKSVLVFTKRRKRSKKAVDSDQTTDQEEENDEDTKNSDDEWTPIKNSTVKTNQDQMKNLEKGSDTLSSGKLENTPETKNKCKYCERKGKVKSYSSNYNLVKHLRDFHAKELEGDDKSVLTFIKRRKRSKKSLKSSGQEEETEEEWAQTKAIKKDTTSPCNYCPKIYANRMSLLKHLRTVHKNELTEKDKKILVIIRRSVNKVRLSKKDPESDIYSRVHDRMCMFCWEEFDNVKELEAHKKIHDNVERPFLCPREGCGAHFKDRIAVRCHYFSHTKAKNFQCKICAKFFIFISNIRVHVKSVHGLQDEDIKNGIIDCRKENDQNTSEKKIGENNDDVEAGELNESLIEEKQILTQLQDPVAEAKREKDLYRDFDPKTDCEYCLKKFQQQELKVHLEVHKDQEKPYKCPFENCTKDFSKRLYLQNHHYQHVATAWYQCDQCDKFFYKKCDLKAHCVVHLTERSFLCNECGMSFKSLQYLKLHSTVHLDAKKFACKSCDKRFRKSYSLTLHTRAVHTRELPYVCSTCGKRFNSSNHLVVHTRYHTGERPYKCTQPKCSSVHVDFKHLKRHCREVHGIQIESSRSNKNYILKEENDQ